MDLTEWDLDDRDLVDELADLGPVEWPTDEVGDRLALAVVASWGARDGDAPAPPVLDPTGRPAGQRRRRSLRRSRPGRRPAVALAVAACVLLVLVLATGVLRPAPARAPGPAGDEPSTSPTGAVMQLVDSTSSPFEAVGGGPQSGDLTCVTATTCVAQAAAGQAVEVTEDGGRTWQGTAALPDGATLQWPLSCPSTAMCMGTAGGGRSVTPAVAVTPDLGASWQLEPVDAPAGWADASIAQLSCATASACIVQLVGESDGRQVGTFLASADGGATWIAAATVPATSAVVSWALTCSSGGSCVSVGLGPVTAASGTLVALTTHGGGRTWSSRSSVLPIGKGTLLVDWGDAERCVAAFPDASGAMDYATTSTSGASWEVSDAPASWPQQAVALSCATGTACYLSAASAGAGSGPPVIEATHDGGSTWSALGLPDVDGGPLALVFPLSCPVAAGCIGVGATPDEVGGPAGASAGAARAAAASLEHVRCTAPGPSGAGGCRVGSTMLRCSWRAVGNDERCSAVLGGDVRVAIEVHGSTVVAIALPPPGGGATPSDRVILSDLAD